MKIKFIILTLSFLTHISTAQASDTNKQDPLIVVAIAKVKLGQEKMFRNAVSQILEATRKEKGSITFLFNVATENPTEFAFYEQWETQADLDAHLKSPHMQKFFNEVSNAFEAGFPSIKTYRQREK